MKTYKVSVMNMKNEIVNKEGFISIEASSTAIAAKRAAKQLGLKECCALIYSAKTGRKTAIINIF